MKDLAFVKLTKTLVSKMKDKVAEKKRIWAEEAALSVEENKRRESEFKEDFKVVKNIVSSTTQKAKQSIDTTIEIGEKVAEKSQDVSTSDVKKEPISKKDKAIYDLEEKAKEEPVTKSSSASSDTKKEATQKRTSKPTSRAKEETKAKPKSKASTKKSKPTSKKEEKLALYRKDVIKHYGEVDEEFLEIIVKNLGPSIYRKDAEGVACSDSKELETVRKNFLMKKLGMSESKEVLDTAIKEVCEEMKSARKKYRATFYYALAKKLKQESKLS
jgi:hypothetical protein